MGRHRPPRVVYVYALNRSAVAHLAGFRGVLQVAGYAGYTRLAERGDVDLAFCWSHVRRWFYELAAAGPAPIATEALERIQALYAVESEIRGRDAGTCARTRPARSSRRSSLGCPASSARSCNRRLGALLHSNPALSIVSIITVMDTIDPDRPLC